MGEARQDGRKDTRKRGLVWLRRGSQLLFLLLFVALLIGSSHPVATGAGAPATRAEAPVEIFFRADPFVALLTLLASHRFYVALLPSLAVVALTLLLGRGALCGWGLCPLGTLNHALGWALGPRSKKRRRERNRPAPSSRLKYLVLAACLGAALLGSGAGGWLDPIALITRGLGLVLLPSIDAMAGNAQGSEGGVTAPLSATLGTVLGVLGGFRPQRFQGGWLMGSMLLAILAANAYRPRFWCRALCPLGALLGLLGRLSILAMRKRDDACIDCEKCETHCQGADEPRGRRPWRESECVLCLNCRAACPTDVISFEAAPGRARADAPESRVARRHLVGGAVAGALLVPLSRVGPGRGIADDPRLIRPPGALAERELLSRCVRCGQCMSACPTNAIQPALDEAGPEGVLTPVLVMRIGYCEPSCTTCGQVCPTGAIRPLTVEEKLGRGAREGPVRIGTAFIDRGRCLPWGMGVPCIVCEEFCPAHPKAIRVIEGEVAQPSGELASLERPQVDPSRCTGCGACEFVCPVQRPAAIRVTSAGESRSRSLFVLARRRGEG